jgi:hypothetical protein
MACGMRFADPASLDCLYFFGTGPNREYFEMGVGDMAQAEAEYPGWLGKLLTDPVKGLEKPGRCSTAGHALAVIAPSP